MGLNWFKAKEKVYCCDCVHRELSVNTEAYICLVSPASFVERREYYGCSYENPDGRCRKYTVKKEVSKSEPNPTEGG